MSSDSASQLGGTLGKSHDFKLSLCLKFMESLFISQTTHQKDYLGWLALPIWAIFSFEAKSSLGISTSKSQSLYT